MDVPALDDASGSCSSSRAHEFAFRMKQGGLVMFKSGECWHGSTKVHYGGEDVSAKTGTRIVVSLFCDPRILNCIRNRVLSRVPPPPQPNKATKERIAATGGKQCRFPPPRY